MVSAELVRAHLCELRAAGVGLPSVCEITGIKIPVLREMRNGKRKRIRQSTEERIMRISRAALAAGAVISAARTNSLIRKLLQEGFTRSELAAKLGYKTRDLQFYKRPRITVRNATQVERMYRLLMLNRLSEVPRAQRKVA